MIQIWVYTLVSVFIVSIVSLLGIALLALKAEKLKEILHYLVSFSAGALLGDAFIHLIPELIEESGFGLEISLYLLLGIIFSFAIEKFIRWRHCHLPPDKEHVHPFAIMSLWGDAIHNFIDGLIIAGSYLLSVPVGIATTIAVFFHEVPQEVGDFAVLLQGGFSKFEAIMLNFITAFTAVVGAVLALILASYIPNITSFLVPFAAGGFIYIAGTDLMPELHKEVKIEKSAVQFVAFLAGIGMMIALPYIG